MFNVPVNAANEIISSLFEDINNQRIANNYLQAELQKLKAGYRADMFAATLNGIGIGMLAAVVISIIIDENSKK